MLCLSLSRPCHCLCLFLKLHHLSLASEKGLSPMRGESLPISVDLVMGSSRDTCSGYLNLKGNLIQPPCVQVHPHTTSIKKKSNLGGDMTTPSRFIVLGDVHPFVCYFFLRTEGVRGCLSSGAHSMMAGTDRFGCMWVVR